MHIKLSTIDAMGRSGNDQHVALLLGYIIPNVQSYLSRYGPVILFIYKVGMRIFFYRKQYFVFHVHNTIYQVITYEK